ncbi:Hypp9338 [Branchiostoma lanceolatum]|uniref:1-alkyl-2-acetylglycerophosphocholine esterase n=1 Tax=Branchiostoma lanceolatum TaxID=7740 RepID=A0A8S4MLI1_BRALA|nr:Hypp9338 [Branchiostoma lanceolatum]
MKVVTIHFYHTGTILLHGKGLKWYAESIFPQVKEVVNKLVCESLRQDGGHDDGQSAPEGPITIDSNIETIETSSDDETPAITVTDNDSQENNADPDQSATPKPVLTHPTAEKENRADFTTPKSVTSPTIRRVLGGLENIILSPFTKGKSKEEKRARRTLIGGNSVSSDEPEQPTEAKHEAVYTALVDDLNEYKTLVFRNKVTIDKQGENIDNLQANLQNRKKENAKQAQQIGDLQAELQRQRDITSCLTDALASQRTDYEALQTQVVLLTNQTQSLDIPTRPDFSDTQGDKSRIDRLYSEIVTGVKNSVSKVTTGVPGAEVTRCPRHSDIGNPPNQVSGKPRYPVNGKPRHPPGGKPRHPPGGKPRHPPGGKPRHCTQTGRSTAAPTPNLNARGPTTQVRVFADSIWNDVDPNKFYRNKSTSIAKSTTIPRAKENISTSPDTSTELVIIHTGSNDLDNSKARPASVDICVEQTSKLIDSARKSYPNAKIVMSQVLPRGTNMESRLNRNIASYNASIEKTCRSDSTLTYIRHRLLSEDRTLYKPDGIHIRPDTGVRLMVADVKRTLRHEEEATSSRQHWNPGTVQRSPPRPFLGDLPNPAFPWKSTPRPPPQWNNWNRQAAPFWMETQDKRHAAEKVVNMLTDFLKN